jgi:hypothetical protein
MEEQKEKQMNVDVVNPEEGQVEREPRDKERPDGGKTSKAEQEFLPLFEGGEAEKFRSQWLDIQGRFVDDPPEAVKEADKLVADVIKSITSTFADQRMSMEAQWKTEDDRSTEDLRLAIQRYRSFFNRLLMLES